MQHRIQAASDANPAGPVFCAPAALSSIALLLALLTVSAALPAHAQSGAPDGGLTLAGARISGTREISQQDLLRGLNLGISQPVTLSALRAACRALKALELFHSYQCDAVREEDKAWIVLDVPASSTSAQYEDEIIFDNFVWLTRADLLARIKQAIPLFTSHLQINSPLNAQVLPVLNQIATDRVPLAHVVRDEFWTERNKNVYKVEGIHVPVVAISVEGQNAPRSIRQWAQGYESNEFSMALLNWRLNSVLEEAYFPRGYLHPIVQEPQVVFLGGKNGAFPVRIVLRIDSGPLYTFKALRLEGRAAAHKDELGSDWSLKPGAPYDLDYARQFFFSVTKYDWARAAKRSAAGLDCMRIDEIDRTVTLTIKIPETDADLALSPEAKPCADPLLDSFFPGNLVMAAGQ